MVCICSLAHGGGGGGGGQRSKRRYQCRNFSWGSIGDYVDGMDLLTALCIGVRGIASVGTFHGEVLEIM